jgi:hypothetical protein
MSFNLKRTRLPRINRLNLRQFKHRSVAAEQQGAQVAPPSQSGQVYPIEQVRTAVATSVRLKTK